MTVNGVEALVEQAQGQAPPFIFPPPPGSPVDAGPTVKVLVSLNKTVTAANKAIVTQGIAMQGSTPTWPGMVMRGSGTVTVNEIPINVVGEQAQIFPSGASGVFNQSGQ